MLCFWLSCQLMVLKTLFNCPGALLNKFNTLEGAFLFRTMVGQDPLQTSQCVLCNRQVSQTSFPQEVMLRLKEGRSVARILQMLQCTHSSMDFDMDMVSNWDNDLLRSVFKL